MLAVQVYARRIKHVIQAYTSMKRKERRNSYMRFLVLVTMSRPIHYQDANRKTPIFITRAMDSRVDRLPKNKKGIKRCCVRRQCWNHSRVGDPSKERFFVGFQGARTTIDAHLYRLKGTGHRKKRGNTMMPGKLTMSCC